MRNDWQSHGKYFYGGGYTFPCARAQFVRHYVGGNRPFLWWAHFFPPSVYVISLPNNVPDCTIFFPLQNVIGTYAAHDTPATASRDNNGALALKFGFAALYSAPRYPFQEKLRKISANRPSFARVIRLFHFRKIQL